MKAFVLDQFGIENLKQMEIDEPPPLESGEVLVRFHSASINYRDTLVIAGKYDPRFPIPLIPLSDGSGVVHSLGKNTKRFKIGDKIITPFAPDWIDGTPERVAFRNTLGGPLPGTLKEYGIFKESSLIPCPNSLSLNEASTLPCAGLTAWSALVEESHIQPGDTVLVQGTGGVSLFALQIAKHFGARVILTTTSPEKIEKIKNIEFDELIDVNRYPEWSKEVRRLTNKRGVDHIIEVGGKNTLPESIKACSSFGTISLIGVLGGSGTETNLLPVVMNQIKMQGIVVGSVQSLGRFVKAIDAWNLKPIIHEIIDWKESKQVLENFPKGKHIGKVVLRIND
jgi:NADPH:quinone reductase-like Zn-dependent oxidoreductase